LVTPVGSAFKTDSKYDNGMPFSCVINDKINEYRMDRFHEDIEEKTIIALLIFLTLSIFGRYIYLGVTWVSKTSSLE